MRSGEKTLELVFLRGFDILTQVGIFTALGRDKTSILKSRRFRDESKHSHPALCFVSSHG
jgi:hypothetical protein